MRKMKYMMKKLKKNFRVLRELVRIRFQRLMLFRLGFFGPFFVDGSLFAVQLMVFRAVYSNVDRIGSWGEGEMTVFIGTFSLINAVGMTVYFFGIQQLPGKIRNGEMDLYLTKPASPLLRLTFEQVNPGSIPLLLMSLCIIGYGAGRAEIPLEPGRVLLYLGWLAIMILLHYDMMVLIRCVCFYLVTNARLEQLEDAALELCMKLPGIAFYGIYRVVFCFLLPYGLMATLPVQSVLGELGWQEALQGCAVTAVFTGLTAFVWRQGLRHYNSASS